MNFLITAFNEIIFRPILNLLVFVIDVIPGSDLGLAIILVTVAVRILLYPLSHKALVSQKKISRLQPKLKEIQKIHPDIQYYPVDKLTYPMPNDPTFDHENHVKIPAGWLLDELGWRGKRIGNVGTSQNQALVVINLGGASAQEILDFTKLMQNEFEEAYNIKLEPEVNII